MPLRADTSVIKMRLPGRVDLEARLVESSIDYMNALMSDKPDVRAAEGSFRWVPDKGVLQAWIAGIGLENVRWVDREIGLAKHLRNASYLRTALLRLRPDSAEINPAIERLPAGFQVIDDLLPSLNKALAGVPIYQRLVVTSSGGIRPFSVPLLTNIDSCVTYSIALLFGSRRVLAERIQPCPYLRKPKTDYPHWFADFQFDREGIYQTPAGHPRSYCCSQHSNAHRQRRQRERDALARRSEKPK